MRVVILGNSGSGKSLLARAIAAWGRARVLELDAVAWEPAEEPTARDESEARRLVEAFCRGGQRWVVEGCYANLVEPALAHGAKLILLDPGLEVCLAHCRARPFEPTKYASPKEQDARLEFLLSWVAEYSTRSGPLSRSGHRACFDAFDGPKLELRDRPSLDPLDPGLLAWLA